VDTNAFTYKTGGEFVIAGSEHFLVPLLHIHSAGQSVKQQQGNAQPGTDVSNTSLD